MFSDRLRYLEIKLSDWVFRAITSAEVLRISRDYFRLRSPVDRRIYEIAPKHCGRQASWRIDIDALQHKAGSKQERRFFVTHLRKLVASNHLPDFAATNERTNAAFYNRGIIDCVTETSRAVAAETRRDLNVKRDSHVVQQSCICALDQRELGMSWRRQHRHGAELDRRWWARAA